MKFMKAHPLVIAAAIAAITAVTWFLIHFGINILPFRVLRTLTDWLNFNSRWIWTLLGNFILLAAELARAAIMEKGKKLQMGLIYIS